jgi:hypothetical protein
MLLESAKVRAFYTKTFTTYWHLEHLLYFIAYYISSDALVGMLIKYHFKFYLKDNKPFVH